MRRNTSVDPFSRHALVAAAKAAAVALALIVIGYGLVNPPPELSVLLLGVR